MAALDRALARGRRAAERLMVDTCVIRRRTGETTDDDGNVVPTYAPVYGGSGPGGGGPCRLQQPTGTAQQREAGEATLLMVRYELQLPMSALGVEADDEVEMTASHRDPDLPGRTFTVRGLSHKTHGVMRRLQVEERTS